MSLTIRVNNISSPRLWIKRVILFDSSENKNAPIRNIPFHRGLNIVWGVELPDNAGVNGANPVTLFGHSVGKTILCRLIRYCLGESNFGNPSVVSRIRYAFPNGWVGMELTVESEDWSVLKPIGHCGNSKAAQSIAVERLFEQNRRENKYHQFMSFLQGAMLSGMRENAHPNADRPYEWVHLLAWLARDQESRFQSLHGWRSLRSGADTLRFQKSKEYALYLIRLVLNLVQDKELEISRAIAEEERELNQRETRISELRREPEYRFREQEEALRRLLGIPSTEELNADESDLFSNVFTWRKKIEDDISKGECDIEKIDSKISQKRLWLASYDEDLRIFRSSSQVVEEAIERAGSQESEDETIQKLRELRGQDCTYGDVPFTQCSYVQERISNSNKKIIELQKVREDRRLSVETGNRLSFLEEQQKNHDQIVCLLNELNQKLNRDIAEKNVKEIDMAGYREQLHRLDHHLEQRQQALDLMEGRKPNTEMQKESDHAKDLRQHIEQQRQELQTIQESLQNQVKTIEKIYDSLIKGSLSDTYSGKLRMPKGELKFIIEEETGLTGEAVETLALVLADVAAMMCSCQSIGNHPRFLLHDSPREADLDRHIYDRYLRLMWTLTNEYGGKENAPFQYIVTTTSGPPKDLTEAICLRLQAHPESEMLFRRTLTYPPLKEQILFFGEENEL